MTTAADGTATAAAQTDDQFYGAEVDGEVSVKMSDFPAGPIEKDPRIVMAAEDVEAIVRASANFGGSETDMAALSFIDPGRERRRVRGRGGSGGPLLRDGRQDRPGERLQRRQERRRQPRRGGWR